MRHRPTQIDKKYVSIRIGQIMIGKQFVYCHHGERDASYVVLAVIVKAQRVMSR